MSSKVKKFPVVELFGPTIQGEGVWIGKRCLFVRFAGCDFSCSWCDSKHSWDPKHPKYGFTKMTALEIVQELCELDPRVEMIVITGGNPLLHKLQPFVEPRLWNQVRMQAPPLFSIETQGTLFSPWVSLCHMLTISPKLENAGVGSVSTRVEVQEVFDLARAGNLYIGTCVKPVGFGEADVLEAWSKFQGLANVDDFVFQVGTQSDDDEMSLIKRWREIVDVVLSNSDMSGVRVLPQTHVLLWGHRLGV